MAPLIMKKRLSIGNQVLKIAYLWSIDRGKIDFVENARGQRKPNTARRRIGGADRIFVTPRPPRLNPGLSEGNGVLRLLFHGLD
jgi:hypothetical protein